MMSMRTPSVTTSHALRSPEDAYMPEFDAWLRANFGYGRDSVSETEALEESLVAGRDVPGAVRVND
jgi:hypothetical protein